MLHTKFQGCWSIGSGEKNCKGFFHIWWPYWSCGLDGFNIIMFLPPLEALLNSLIQTVLD